MKPKRELKQWVRVALLLLPEVVIIGLLFFVAVKLNNLDPEIVIDINYYEERKVLEVIYE